jgi:hypothetical protein
MAQQSSGEFASADPTKGEEDARVQKRGIRAKVSLCSCSSPQHIQRPTPPDISQNAPSLPGLGDADMARSRHRGVISATRNFPHQISDNVTKPGGGRNGKPCSSCRCSQTRFRPQMDASVSWIRRHVRCQIARVSRTRGRAPADRDGW